jgi:hypothetical protein
LCDSANLASWKDWAENSTARGEGARATLLELLEVLENQEFVLRRNEHAPG